MLADLRDALRQLRKAPGFTATVVITLALGIGATTAIFTLVHQVMLKSLPVTKPEELWRIGDKIRCCNWGGYRQGDDGDFSLFSWEAYKNFREHTPEFVDLAALQAGNTLECHFDEEEILARWRCVEALNHANFLRFERYGQIELDGSPVVYAVFEKVDANLAEVLDQGHLAVKDAAQLASSLVTVLDVLHGHGFIHEHIEPRNIFAVDNVVKVRSDCIREAPEGEEGRIAKQRDVRDFATVLLQTLTQRQSLDGIPDYALPQPFGQIICKGFDGTWGLENIRAALEGQIVSTPRAVRQSHDATLPTPAVVEQKTPSAPANPSTQPDAQLSLPLFDEDEKSEFAGASARRGTWDKEQTLSLRSRWIGVIGIVATLVLLATWVLPHTWNAHQHKTAPAAAAPDSQPAAQSAKHASSSPESKPVIPVLAHEGLPSSAGPRPNWRVIAFTYKRKADAEKEASSLAHSHPNLQAHGICPSRTCSVSDLHRWSHGSGLGLRPGPAFPGTRSAARRLRAEFQPLTGYSCAERNLASIT